MQIVYNIIYVIVGALVTFSFQLLLKRIPEKRPLIIWSILNPVKIPTTDKYVYRIYIKNYSPISAQNVRMHVKIHKNCTIENFELVISEHAAERRQIDTNLPNTKEYNIPIFYGNSFCEINFVASFFNLENFYFSLVGDNGVKGEKALTQQINKTIRLEASRRKRTKVESKYTKKTLEN